MKAKAPTILSVGAYIDFIEPGLAHLFGWEFAERVI